LPPAQRCAARWLQDCNYAQALETEIDEAHASFLRGRLDAAPRYTVHETPYGLACGARHSAEGHQHLWRVNLFLMPCFMLSPPADDPHSRLFRACVPADDEHTSVVCIAWRSDGPVRERERSNAGRRTRDALVTESAGTIVDRTREQLGTSDKAVVAFRRRLLAAADLLLQGVEPQAPYDPDCYRVRAHSELVPRDERDFNEHDSIRRGMLAP
jgi:hypothetical protein